MTGKKAGKHVQTKISYKELSRKLVAEILSTKTFEEQEDLWNELIAQGASELNILPLLLTDIGQEYKARIISIFLAPSEIFYTDMPFSAPRLMPTDPTPRVKIVSDIPAELLPFTTKLVVGALQKEFYSLVESAVELLGRLEPGTKEADELYESIPLAFTLESGEFGYHGYMELMTESAVPQVYKENADAIMQKRILEDWQGDPAIWYARTLEFISLDLFYDPAFFVSQLEFIRRSSRNSGKWYEDVFGSHNGVFVRIYHLLADEEWNNHRLMFIAFAKEYIETWAMEEQDLSQHQILQNIANDAESWDEEFSARIRALIEINQESLRREYDGFADRTKKIADILSRMR